MTSQLKKKFRKRYGKEPRIFRAPGRVNLIGEHTDYNDGFVMPAAIDFYTRVAAAVREDHTVSIHSVNFSDDIEFDLNKIDRMPDHWSNYARGVAWALQQTGHSLRGADLWVEGTVPIGAGLSSSASLEIAVAFALAAFNGPPLEPAELARIGQRAESEFVGMRCGIMDQFIACLGEEGHALMLDCRSLEYRLLPLDDHVAIVVCNTMVKHELASSEYNTRRAECEEGIRHLAPFLPGISSLRDVRLAQVESHSKDLPETIYRRCRHVVSENQRVEKAAEALRSHDLKKFGRLMAESHESLRENYEVSCPELDLMVELANQCQGVYGARMTGGGFGGSTVNLVERKAAGRFREFMTREYERQTSIAPEVYICDTAAGVEEIA